MYKNYLTVAVRNFRRNKVFSLINIIGLAIGISTSLVIYLIVSFDFSFDKFEKDGDRIFRVVSDMHFPDQEFKNSGVPLPLPAAVKREIPGLEMVIPFHTGNGDLNVQIGNPGANGQKFKKQAGIIYADNNYLNLLSYQWIAGSSTSSLKDPFTVVLTESRAKSYFHSNDPRQVIGKVITYNDSIHATVTGIVRDIHETTDFNFKEFISYSTIYNSGLAANMGWGEWGSVNSSSQLLVKLKKGIGPAQVKKQIEAVEKRNAKNAYLEMTYDLQPLANIHFNSDYGTYGDRQGHLPTLYGLMVFSGLLLLLACINFINLTTAQAAQRSKEIGIRKTMGGSKWQLVFQFLTETFLLTLFAMILSVLLIPWLLKIFSEFIPPAIHIGMLWHTDVIMFIMALLLVVTLLSGFYPSLVLSGYKPALVLKNQAFAGTAKTGRAWLRKFLTVTQFIVAQAFVIGAFFVARQIHFTLNKDLGFKKDGIVVVNTPWRFDDNGGSGDRNVLLDKIQRIPEVQKACLGGAPPASDGIVMQTMKFNSGKKNIETTVELKYADEAYFNLYKMKLVSGRFPVPSDSITEYVINETYARFLGFKNPADAVGKFIGEKETRTPIVGVMEDFYSQSLHTPIKPLVFTAIKSNQTTLHILLKPDNGNDVWKTAIEKIEASFKSVYPAQDFQYQFLDDSIAKFYKNEQDILTLLNWATGLAILISCLGLLGLVIYSTNQRTKEIGVRKVLGASVLQIVVLIATDFMKLVLLAFIIAVPLAWTGTDRWLQNFAYRTEISWWIFVAAGASMVVTALITLGFRTVKVAMANPVDSLRTE